jgi:hypothetical protein
MNEKSTKPVGEPPVAAHRNHDMAGPVSLWCHRSAMVPPKFEMVVDEKYPENILNRRKGARLLT